MKITNDNFLPGSGLDIKTETPFCLLKNQKCIYWKYEGCQISVCWLESVRAIKSVKDTAEEDSFYFFANQQNKGERRKAIKLL